MNIWTVMQDDDDPLFEAWSARTKAISAHARKTTRAMPAPYRPPAPVHKDTTATHKTATTSSSSGGGSEAPEKDETSDRPAIGASLYGPDKGFRYPGVTATPAIRRKTKKVEALAMSDSWTALHEAGGPLLEKWSDAARAASHAARKTKAKGGNWRKAGRAAYKAASLGEPARAARAFGRSVRAEGGDWRAATKRVFKGWGGKRGGGKSWKEAVRAVKGHKGFK